MASLTIHLPNPNKTSELNETVLSEYMNISKLTILAPSPGDRFLHAPESILVMLLFFLIMLLLMVIFCLLTNPVQKQVEQEKKKSIIMVAKTSRKENLKIDYIHLEVSNNLENLSKIDMIKLSEQATIKTMDVNLKQKSSRILKLASLFNRNAKSSQNVSGSGAQELRSLDSSKAASVSGTNAKFE